MKKLLHQGHMGMVKMKQRAKTIMFWPMINTEIEDLVNNCESCQCHQNQQSSEPLIPHNIPKRPWTKVATDLFELNSKLYLIIVDYSTSFFEIAEIPNKLSETIVTHTKKIFSIFGIPNIVVSDNEPEYIGSPYKQFATQWDFEHITSSPRYPQSNGKIERTIQHVKRTLKKSLENSEDIYLALLNIRTTQGPDNTAPPATQLFQRTIIQAMTIE